MCDSHVNHPHSVAILQGRQQGIVRLSVEIRGLWNGGFSLVRKQMQVSIYTVFVSFRTQESLPMLPFLLWPVKSTNTLISEMFLFFLFKSPSLFCLVY